MQLALVCNVTIICLHTLLPGVFTDFFPTCDRRDVAQKSGTPLANYSFLFIYNTVHVSVVRR